MTNEDVKGLDTLTVWQKARDFAIHVCSQVLSKFPESEKYALTSQLRRSVQSIPANIAEGYGRHYYQEGVRFAYISRGSLEETYNHLVFANGLNYLDENEFNTLVGRIAELKRLTNGYINYLKKSKRGVNEPGSYYYSDNLVKINEKEEI